MSDKNFISFSGDATGNVWLNGEKLFDASAPGIREYFILGDVVPEPGMSDTLKFSGAQRLAFYETKIGDDSGNPACLILDGQLVLLTVWTFGGAADLRCLPRKNVPSSSSVCPLISHSENWQMW